MALQGLRGVAEINQQAQISQQLKEYQARLGSAVANNDRVGVQKLMAQYPQFMADSQNRWDSLMLSKIGRPLTLP